MCVSTDCNVRDIDIHTNSPRLNSLLIADSSRTGCCTSQSNGVLDSGVCRRQRGRREENEECISCVT